MTIAMTSQNSSESGLDDLFDRVNQLLDDTTVSNAAAVSPPGRPPKATATLDADSGSSPDAASPSARVATPPTVFATPPVGNVRRDFTPRPPQSIAESGISDALLERLILKHLQQVGMAAGRVIASQVQLPYKVVEPTVRQLRSDKFIDLIGTTTTGDSQFVVTESGRERGKRYAEDSTYFGAAPIALPDYINSVSAQSIEGQQITLEHLKHAFKGLLINEAMFNRLGPAINSGRGMFLFGEPGNGKTSIAERITEAFGSTVWIPRAIHVDGDIIRVFDPSVHEEIIDHTQSTSLLDSQNIDGRWVQIRRPTVIAGGELTMDELEVTKNTQTNVCEAPLQLKSNCGTLVIDDFGRQKMPVDMLLNRWIVPLEKRYDFLNLPSGKKICIPFDQLIIFSTNLEPRELVDGAFLRRIPYKIEVPDPSEAEFRELLSIMCDVLEFEQKPDAFDYLVETHYKAENRAFKLCQPRDLLLQVRNFCHYHQRPLEISNEAFDSAVDNYFAVM